MRMKRLQKNTQKNLPCLVLMNSRVLKLGVMLILLFFKQEESLTSNLKDFLKMRWKQNSLRSKKLILLLIDSEALMRMLLIMNLNTHG
jgi:hypothetical protein